MITEAELKSAFILYTFRYPENAKRYQFFATGSIDNEKLDHHVSHVLKFMKEFEVTGDASVVRATHAKYGITESMENDFKACFEPELQGPIAAVIAAERATPSINIRENDVKSAFITYSSKHPDDAKKFPWFTSGFIDDAKLDLHVSNVANFINGFADDASILRAPHAKHGISESMENDLKACFKPEFQDGIAAIISAERSKPSLHVTETDLKSALIVYSSKHPKDAKKFCWFTTGYIDNAKLDLHVSKVAKFINGFSGDARLLRDSHKKSGITESMENDFKACFKPELQGALAAIIATERPTSSLNIPEADIKSAFIVYSSKFPKDAKIFPWFTSGFIDNEKLDLHVAKAAKFINGFSGDASLLKAPHAKYGITVSMENDLKGCFKPEHQGVIAAILSVEHS